MLAKNPISWVARLTPKTAPELSVRECAALGTTGGAFAGDGVGVVRSTDDRRGDGRPRFLSPSLDGTVQFPGREVGGSSPDRRSYSSTQSPSGSDRKTKRISPSSNGGISTRAPSATSRSTTASRSVTRKPRWSSSSPTWYGGSPG